MIIAHVPLQLFRQIPLDASTGVFAAGCIAGDALYSFFGSVFKAGFGPAAK